MKFNEKKLKILVQNETTEWDAADLSWFDESLLLKFENKQLSHSEHESMVDMMAHDQAVLNHYLHLKQQIKSDRKASRFFSRHHWVLASILIVAATLLIWVNPIEYRVSAFDDISRGTSEVQVYPARNAELNSLPAHFVGPEFQQLVRVELLLDKAVVWQSEWQKSQRFMLPLSFSDNQPNGAYQWRMVSEKNKEMYASNFTVVN